MNFYALYSKSRQQYNTPFLANYDEEAVALVSKTVVSQQDPALVMSLDDLTLVKVGAFYPELPVPIEEFSPEDVLSDLHETLPLPPMIKSQVDKIYKRKEEANDRTE